MGAAGFEGIEVFLADMAAREALRLLDHVFDKVVDWVMRRRAPSGEEVSVAIYGSGGEVMKSVLVEPDGGLRDWPIDRPGRRYRPSRRD